MSWETRNGRGSYYTRSKRVNGKVVREYIGAGPMAAILAADDTNDRQNEYSQHMKRASERSVLDEIDQLMAEYYSSVEENMRDEIIGAGYRLHHRSEWRKTRQRKD